MNRARGEGLGSFAILSGVSRSRILRLLELGMGDACATRGLSPITGEPLRFGLSMFRISMLSDNSRERECNGWLGLGKRHGWSDGRRGGECRKDGVRRGSYGDGGTAGSIGAGEVDRIDDPLSIGGLSEELNAWGVRGGLSGGMWDRESG